MVCGNEADRYGAVCFPASEVTGGIQIPPDGQPIILGWDGPVTGGYPVIAAVITADVPRLAQLKPGNAIRFVTIEVETARELAGLPWEFKELA